MSQQDADLIRGIYDAFSRGDIPAVMAGFAQDIEWNAPDVLPHGSSTRGHDGVGAFFAGLAGRWSDFGLEIDDVVDSGSTVYGRGRAAGKLGGTPTGYGFVHVFTVRDGKVARFDEYVAPPAGGFPPS
jgi:ketosteroid isomerase-like protein